MNRYRRLYVPLVLAVLMTAEASVGQTTQAGPAHPLFKVDPNWPKQLPNGYFFGGIGGITVDSHDNIWVISRPRPAVPAPNDPPNLAPGIPAPSVVELGEDGHFIQGWGGRFAMSDAERA